MAIQVQTLYRTVSPTGDTSGIGEIAPLIERQFISFSYRPLSEETAKNIEDFNLVATFSDSGLSKGLTSEVQDITEQYAELDGQFWYRTTYSPNTLSFVLATDGMDEQELNDFIRWFKPGELGELILSEHHNRKILARVSSAPKMEMIPFEKEVTFKIVTKGYTTKTSEYKGTITLDFVMDYPFWTAIEKCFDLESEGYTQVSESEKQLILKAIYEDRIPTKQQITQFENALINDDLYIVTELIENGDARVGLSRVGFAIVGESYIYRREQDHFDLKPNGDSMLLYYPGTAPSYPVISFDLTLDSDGFTENYISMIGNHHVSQPNSWLKIGSNKMNFTLPGFLACYNEAVKVISSETSTSYEDLYRDIRENVVDRYMCPLVISSINEVRGTKLVLTDADKISIINAMKEKLPENYSFIIDCKTGECTVHFILNNKEMTQNCGDMIKSRYIKIDERSRIKVNGMIDESSMLSITSSIDMNNFKIKYDFMYL